MFFIPLTIDEFYGNLPVIDPVSSFYVPSSYVLPDVTYITEFDENGNFKTGFFGSDDSVVGSFNEYLIRTGSVLYRFSTVLGSSHFGYGSSFKRTFYKNLIPRDLFSVISLYQMANLNPAIREYIERGEIAVAESISSNFFVTNCGTLYYNILKDYGLESDIFQSFHSFILEYYNSAFYNRTLQVLRNNKIIGYDEEPESVSILISPSFKYRYLSDGTRVAHLSGVFYGYEFTPYPVRIGDIYGSSLPLAISGRSKLVSLGYTLVHQPNIIKSSKFYEYLKFLYPDFISTRSHNKGEIFLSSSYYCAEFSFYLFTMQVSNINPDVLENYTYSLDVLYFHSEKAYQYFKNDLENRENGIDLPDTVLSKDEQFQCCLAQCFGITE